MEGHLIWKIKVQWSLNVTQKLCGKHRSLAFFWLGFVSCSRICAGQYGCLQLVTRWCPRDQEEAASAQCSHMSALTIWPSLEARSLLVLVQCSEKPSLRMLCRPLHGSPPETLFHWHSNLVKWESMLATILPIQAFTFCVNRAKCVFSSYTNTYPQISVFLLMNIKGGKNICCHICVMYVLYYL